MKRNIKEDSWFIIMDGIKYFELANKYYNGDDVEENIELALKNYLNAIKFGYSTSDVYYQLGLIYSENEEYLEFNKAIDYFIEAYKKGDRDSAINIFYLYSKSNDIMDLIKSINWVLKTRNVINYIKDLEKTLNKLLLKLENIPKTDLDNYAIRFKQLCYKCVNLNVKKIMFNYYNDIIELKNKDDYILSLPNVDYLLNEARKNNNINLITTYLNRRFNVVTQITKNINDAIETYNIASEYNQSYLQDRICFWIGDAYLEKKNIFEAESWYLKSKNQDPIILKEKLNSIEKERYSDLYLKALNNENNCQVEFLKYCINNYAKNFVEENDFVSILNLFNKEDKIEDFINYGYGFFKNKGEKETVYNLLYKGLQISRLNTEEEKELKLFTNKIYNYFTDLEKYGFNGFLRGEHLENIVKIFNSGYFLCRNKANCFKDIANVEIVNKTHDFVKEYARFYYSTNALTYYNFKSQNPHKIVFLVFDWSIATIPGTLLANGNAASDYTNTQNIIEHLYNDKLIIDWETVFDSSMPYDDNEFVYYEIKRKRNTELLVPGKVELKKYLKKIVFESKNQMEMFYNNNVDLKDLDYYKSISEVDAGYFK